MRRFFIKPWALCRGDHHGIAYGIAAALILAGFGSLIWGLRAVGEIEWCWVLLGLLLAEAGGFTLFFGVPCAWNWAWLCTWACGAQEQGQRDQDRQKQWL